MTEPGEKKREQNKETDSASPAKPEADHRLAKDTAGGRAKESENMFEQLSSGLKAISMGLAHPDLSMARDAFNQGLDQATGRHSGEELVAPINGEAARSYLKGKQVAEAIEAGKLDASKLSAEDNKSLETFHGVRKAIGKVPLYDQESLLGYVEKRLGEKARDAKTTATPLSERTSLPSQKPTTADKPTAVQKPATGDKSPAGEKTGAVGPRPMPGDKHPAAEKTSAAVPRPIPGDKSGAPVVDKPSGVAARPHTDKTGLAAPNSGSDRPSMVISNAAADKSAVGDARGAKRDLPGIHVTSDKEDDSKLTADKSGEPPKATTTDRTVPFVAAPQATHDATPAGSGPVPGGESMRRSPDKADEPKPAAAKSGEAPKLSKPASPEDSSDTSRSTLRLDASSPPVQRAGGADATNWLTAQNAGKRSADAISQNPDMPTSNPAGISRVPAGDSPGPLKAQWRGQDHGGALDERSREQASRGDTADGALASGSTGRLLGRTPEATESRADTFAGRLLEAKRSADLAQLTARNFPAGVHWSNRIEKQTGPTQPIRPASEQPHSPRPFDQPMQTGRSQSWRAGSEPPPPSGRGQSPAGSNRIIQSRVPGSSENGASNQVRTQDSSTQFSFNGRIQNRYITGAEIALAAIIAASGIRRLRAEESIAAQPQARGAEKAISRTDGTSTLHVSERTIPARILRTMEDALTVPSASVGPRSFSCAVRVADKRYITGAELTLAAILASAGISRISSHTKIDSFGFGDQNAGAKPFITPSGKSEVRNPDSRLPEVESKKKRPAEPDSELVNASDSGQTMKGSDAEAPPRKRVVLHRETVMIGRKDTLVSLAEHHRHDRNLGWLIADLNPTRIKETMMDSKRIVEVRSREQLELPALEDVEEFYANRPQHAVPENLITIVVENEIDVELLDSNLSTLFSDPALDS